MHILHGGPAGSTYALYGARESLLLPPVQFADEAAMQVFIEPYFQTPGQREVFRLALIAQGMGALSGTNLLAQIMHALHIGVLRLAPVAVSGLQRVKTEPGRAALSGKPYIPPLRENPRPEPAPPEPRYKIALEVAGQNTQGLAGTLAISPADNPNALRIFPTHNQGSDTHRLECALNGLSNTPFSVWYRITMQGGAPMRLRLVETLEPVDQDAQQARWPTVLVPVLPLRYSADAKNIRADATRPAQGWIYILVNGTLWRELQVVNAQGALRDVDLGAPDGVGDRRVARGQCTSQIIVPFQLAGAEQKVEMAYSRRQFTWVALMKLGGLAADDVRFTGAVKQDAANIAVDDALRKHFLQPIDLSSYGAGFNTQEGSLGPAATALRPSGQQRDALFTWRSEAVPVAYLADRPVKKTAVNVIVGMGIFSARMENLNGGDLGPDVWDPTIRMRSSSTTQKVNSPPSSDATGATMKLT